MGRKTSVYLADEVEERVKASGASLPELIRRGLGAPVPEPLESRLPGLIRSVLDEWWAGHGNGSACAAGNGHEAAAKGQEPPEPRPERAAPSRKAPAKRTRKAPAADETADLRSRAGSLSDRAEATRALAEASGGAVTVASDLPSRPLPETSPGTAMFMEPGGDAPVIPYESPDVQDHGTRKARRNCAHPNMRIRKGVCPDCQEWVTK